MQSKESTKISWFTVLGRRLRVYCSIYKDFYMSQVVTAVIGKDFSSRNDNCHIHNGLFACLE